METKGFLSTASPKLVQCKSGDAGSHVVIVRSHPESEVSTKDREALRWKDTFT